MLVIRHGEKEYKNNQSICGLDPKLTLEGKKLIYDKYYNLIDDFPIPKKIISSPFTRTRETSIIIQKIIKEKYMIYVPIEYENIISEFINEKYIINELLFHPETLVYYHSYNPIRNLEEYQKSIIEYFNNCSENYWYITHGITTQYAAEAFERHIKYPKYGDGFFYKNDNLQLI